jgi:hypothetical protein
MLELLNQLDGFSSDERIKVRASVRFAYCLVLIYLAGHRRNKSHRHPRPGTPSFRSTRSQD